MANDATKNRIPNSSADNGPDSLLPIWLNNEFLQSKFQQYFNDTELKVIDFRSAAGSGGFVSSILRLTVNLNKAPGNHVRFIQIYCSCSTALSILKFDVVIPIFLFHSS